jgi:hypothetical protein
MGTHLIDDLTMHLTVLLGVLVLGKQGASHRVGRHARTLFTDLIEETTWET